MIILTYDISDDRLRTQFSKFLEKYGRRLQYSVFEIKNSRRILELIKEEIEYKFKKRFSQSDSVIIFDIPRFNNIIKFGYIKNEDEDLVSF